KLQVAGLTTFGEDPDGRLYAASQGGTVVRFAPAGCGGFGRASKYTWTQPTGGAMRCLLLDAAMRPMTLVSRERAVSLVVCGNAQVIAEEPSVIYHSEHLSVALPVILQVPAYVELRPIVRRNVVRRVLFCRDSWRCAYCGGEGGPLDLTIDHVKPLSRGGAHEWDNVVAACRRC